MTSMQLRPDDTLGFPGRTYKFFNGSTVYPFGYGLSYTQFNYKMGYSKNSLNIKLNKLQHCRDMKYSDGAYKPPCPAALIDDLKCDYEFEFEIEVDNNGGRDGSEVVMVYAMPPKDISRTLIKQLIAFKRVSVPAGRKQPVKFVLNACKSLSIVDYNAYQLLPSGEHTIVIGDSVLTFPVEVSFEN